jgi:hypothetical protein
VVITSRDRTRAEATGVHDQRIVATEFNPATAAP